MTNPLKRTLIALLAMLALVAAACGDDDDSTESTADDTPSASQPADGSESDDPDPEESTEPQTDTSEDDPEPESTDPALPLGTSSGQWNNTTFGSSGDASVVVVDEDGTLKLDLDVTDGFVLGAGIQSIINLELPNDQLAEGIVVETDQLGTMTIKIVDGQVDVVATGAPVPGISGFTATGTIADGMLNGSYEVQFDAGDPAEGTFEFAVG